MAKINPTPKVNSQFGAPMGRGWDPAQMPTLAHTIVADYKSVPPKTDGERRHRDVATAIQNGTKPGRVYLRSIPLNSGGYDSGGAYWGDGIRLYWAGDDSGAVDMYFRARNRGAAKTTVKAAVPDAVFFR
jgi:hypothetical protein